MMSLDLSLADHGLAAAAALGAGFVNAVAGGGTLISFPILVALGVPNVRANVTNAVALCPGYFGGTYAQRADLKAQKALARQLIVPAGVGGLVGSILLVVSPEKLFRSLVPFLILGACALLGLQDAIKAKLPKRTADATQHRAGPALLGTVFAACVYGGYFGAGLGIITMAVLGFALSDPMPRLNALKQLISASTNVVAAAFFVTSGRVAWTLVAAMAPASLIGGQIGGRVAGRIPAKLLRSLVIAFGIAVAINALR